MIHNKSKLGLNATTPLHLGIQRQVANGPAGSMEVKNPDVFDFDLETTKKFDFYLEDVDEEKNSNSRFKKIFTTSFDKNPKQSFTTERPNLLNPLERGKSSQRRKASESAGSFSSGGLATRKNMEQVIGHIMQNQEQFPFSMIFKDPQLEVQYLHEIHLENKSAVKIPFILITLMACSVIVGDCIRINIPLVCCVWIQSFIHYKYTAKNVRALQLFAPLQSLIIMIVGLEVSIIGGVKIAEVDGLSATSAVATSFVVFPVWPTIYLERMAASMTSSATFAITHT
ncbi:hypothetical protein FGO68_gene16431 [Halteria grandinella]|uniref:Uncharacterized protein n=1 Tax=Halteria grandinella TaxID=5974 RepID=A0A8J8P2M2_HALGN|nr:hypothetical protein FGO68_gene16431 [Halteria grandinella]